MQLDFRLDTSATSKYMEIILAQSSVVQQKLAS